MTPKRLPTIHLQSTSPQALLLQPSGSDSYLHPWGPEAQKTGLAKCLAKDGFSSRQGQMPQLGQGAEVSRSASMAARFRMLRKGDVRGLSPKAWVVKISRDADEQHLRL
ncbi:hypothetical protein N5P37_005344 [Trichoderma harzianum]|nr:hypothetical protein N5P37_005344 [Trichoderma harzianum]